MPQKYLHIAKIKNQTIGNQTYVIAKLSEVGFSRKLDGKIGSKTQFGTPYYLSSEVASNEENNNFNSDIWSLGVVLYEMVTGQLPWFKKNINYEEFSKLIIKKFLSLIFCVLSKIFSGVKS